MIKNSELNLGQIEAIVNKLGGMSGVDRFLAGELVVVPAYSAVVDYSQSLVEMVSAGKYDWVSEGITEKNFPKTMSGKVRVNFELVHFNRNITSDIAVMGLGGMGLRPATIWELLAFGAKYPELQREFPVVALGSVAKIEDSRHVVGFFMIVSKRSVDHLCTWGHDWTRNVRFLAVRK